jgi:hypothetical protein
MDIEEEILAFGETALWVECDLCGRAFGGPSVNRVIGNIGHANACMDCLQLGNFSRLMVSQHP